MLPHSKQEWIKTIYRSLVLATLLLVLFFFYAMDTAGGRYIQKFCKYSNLYSGIVLAVVSIVFVFHDWRLSIWGFIVSAAAVFVGLLPLLAR